MTDDPMDIVSRLRRIVREERGYKNLQMHCVEAADEIERLRGWVRDLQKLTGPFPLAVNLDGDDANERLAQIVDAWNKEPRRDADLRIVADD